MMDEKLSYNMGNKLTITLHMENSA